MKMLIYISIILIGLIAVNCESPLDLDTPRNKTFPDKPLPIQLSLDSINLETNGIFTEFAFAPKANIELDTATSPWRLWGNMTFTSNEITNFSRHRLELLELKLYLDTIKTDANVTLNSPEFSKSYSEYTISRGVSLEYNSIVTSDAFKNISKIWFSLDKDSHNLSIFINSKIFENRVINDSSGSILSFPDSLQVFGNIKFSF